MTNHPQTNGGRLLKRGDTFDIECHRTSYRLQLAHKLLAADGIKPTWTHSDCERVEFGRVKHACDYRCSCEWPERATGAIFDAAYRLADLITTERGAYHQREINKEQAARREAAR